MLTTRKAYLIGKLVVVMLYPLSGGILLQPRRGILASFLGLSRNSNQINHEEHAKNRKYIQCCLVRYGKNKLL
jgi:hypothetical protein